MRFGAQMASALRIVLGRTTAAFAAACIAAVIAVVAPPAALLLLALLAAYVFMRAEAAPQFELRACAGPLFAAAIAGALAGPPVAIGMLFAWRLWADARWSIEEAKRLAISAGRPGEARFASLAHAWATPLFGFAVVAYTAPHMLLGLTLDLPHIPGWTLWGVGAVAAALAFDWIVRRAADWRLGELAPAPAAHLLAHHAIFLLAYGLTIDISAGLIAVAVWRLMHAAPAPRWAQASFTAVP